ncbi:MAG: L,D-transpeptidase family protein [Sulfurovum sp.]|nr:L,D-transpeptidase family protein [Sulfurovum sp.]
MRLLTYILISTLLSLNLAAKPLTMENISLYIQKGLQTRIKGQNKAIIQNIYAKTGKKALWVGSKNAKKTAALIQALNDPLFNYKDKSFDQASISRLYYMLDNNTLSASKKAAVYARLDLILTSSMVRLVRFIVQGDVDWALVQEKMTALRESDDIRADWEMSPKTFPSQQKLIAAIGSGNIYSYLNSLLPMQTRYRKLVKLLKDYKVMNKFPKIPYKNAVLKRGDSASRIREVKKRLQISGDYPKSRKVTKKFDAALEKAIRTYQKRYLLKVTGTIDKTVTYYLNQPASKNIQAIITNLDKTKLYGKSFEEEHIEINIPDFNLRYYRKEVMLDKMGLVVGRIDRPTPLFSDKIDYMVLNPTWTVTDNLIKRDLIPVLEKDPDYLVNHDMHVFRGNKEVNVTYDMLAQYIHSDEKVPYRFVQYPGESNALGRVKFMFPNKYAVYLHDTDNKSLLERRYKLYSSGCMRVNRPFDLLDTLLKHAKGKYSPERIEKILAINKPKTIRMRRSIPVHMIYFTVYEEEGLAYFKHDIYLYDKIIEESVEGNKKSTFKIPSNRMISVKKQHAKQLSN